jgi:undecaprenyl-diphosphatase
MDVLQAIILGIIEGLTEFLPVSSTGHLIVASDLMNYKDNAKVFTVVIQLGAIAAVIWNYRRDLMSKVIGLIKRDKATLRFWAAWIIATIPGGLLGFLLRDKVSVFAVAATVGVALILGGVAIWLIETYHSSAKNFSGHAKFEKITIAKALQVGVFQMLAIIPGVSRSGASIMGGLLTGFDRVTAAAFSFYLSIPLLSLAGVYQLAKGGEGFDTVDGGLTAIIAGTLATFVTALLIIRWLLRYVSTHNFKIFAYYRIVLGIIILLTLSFQA